MKKSTKIKGSKMFTELNKTNNFVITIPKEYFGSTNDKDNMKRLAVEVFAIDDKGIFFFDEWWSECDSGSPTHYFNCKIVETKDGWDLKEFGKTANNGKGDSTGKLEVYSSAKHPEFLDTSLLWQEYLKETGKKDKLKAIVQEKYERQLYSVRKRVEEDAKEDKNDE